MQMGAKASKGSLRLSSFCIISWSVESTDLRIKWWVQESFRSLFSSLKAFLQFIWWRICPWMCFCDVGFNLKTEARCSTRTGVFRDLYLEGFCALPVGNLFQSPPNSVYLFQFMLDKYGFFRSICCSISWTYSNNKLHLLSLLGIFFKTKRPNIFSNRQKSSKRLLAIYHILAQVHSGRNTLIINYLKYNSTDFSISKL